MNQSWSSKRAILDLARGALGLLSVGFALLSLPAFAQIVPDTTLGTESSRVNPNVNIRGLPGDRIDGGAARGSSLFHSFSQFNVNNGQRVYFADPAGIANIFSRVTGSTPSNILGTLGVDGAANLFLLNPNGILFGPNALVDIQGSFVATTGDRFIFPNGAEFGASNPQAPPLLTMSVPVGVQYGAQPGAITNTGNLTVGQDLTLAGGNLDLQGQLRAGRDLTLQAQNTVQARDSAINPFIASAGGKLVVQGNQAVDIVALSHPNSGLFSGGDMVLRSANTVGGDAHYWSGGNFRIEKLDGNLGNLFSPADPVIRASGDVSFDSYTGASLHIFAGGSVTITGGVTITGADAAANSIAETVTLSNGTTLPINGSTQPTLDIRAGTTEIGTPGIIGSTAGFTPGAPGTDGTGTSADITINGKVDFSTPNGGTVFLTNRYNPNSLPSPNGITVGAINTGGRNRGGSVTIDSRSGITVNSQIITSAFTRQQGLSGNINLLSGSNIILNGTLNTSSEAKKNPSILLGNAGKVTLQAGGGISLQPNSKIDTSGLIGGSVTLTSNGDTRITNSTINSKSNNSSQNDYNNIRIQATNGSVFLNNATLSVDNKGSGFAGDTDIDARARIEITNGSNISSDGDNGNISVGSNSTPQTVLIDHSNLTTTNKNGAADQPAGFILINASDSIEITHNSNIYANGNFGIIGIGVASNFAPKTVVIDNNSNLQTNGAADQQAGGIFIDASDSIKITNNSNISANGNFGFIGIGSNSRPQTVLIDNSKLTTNGVNLTTNSVNSVNLTTTNQNGAANQVSNISNNPQAHAGNIEINANSVSLNNRAEISAKADSGKAGNINITATDLLLLRHASNISTSAGTPTTQGDGGTITLNGGFVLAVPSENSNIVANAFGGQGGEIKIDTNRVLGLKPETKVTTQTALNNIIKNPPSQISVGSDIGAEGTIEINSLEVDPSQGLGQLPIDVVDPSNQIATGCGPTGGKTANRQSQFVVTGRGGLPPGPNDLQTPRTTSPGWVTRDVGNVSRADIPDQPPITASTDTLVEAQGMVKTAKGELILTAQSPTSTPHQSGVSTQLCVPASDRR